MYKLLNFTKPEKLRSTEEHNEMYSADCDVPGVYVSNMSDEDLKRWKCKHIKGKDERIEIRRWISANVVILVWKDGDVTMSSNSRILLSAEDWQEMVDIVAEAKQYMNGEK